MQTDSKFKLYLSPNGWMIRFKDGDAWRTKRVPAKHQDRFDAARWAEEWWDNRGSEPGFCPSVSDTIASLCDRWIELLKAKDYERSWKDADSFKRLWVLPFPFAKVKADSLSLAQCVRWVEAVKASGRSDFTVRNVVQRGRSLITEARGRGWIDPEKPNHLADPFIRRMLKGATTVAGPNVIIHVPAEQALKLAKRPDAVPERRHAKYVLAVCSGLRAGELCGLAWRHLDLDSAVPSVRVERQLMRERSFKDPKKRSFRSVPLHPLAVETLRSWREDGFRRHTGRSPGADDPVFPDVRGRFIYDNHAPYFRQDLAAYELPTTMDGHQLDFHSLRRTFMTLLSEAKVSDHVIKQLAGHAKSGVTRRSYIANAEIAALAEEVLKLPFPSPPTKPTATDGKVIDLKSRRRRAG